MGPYGSRTDDDKPVVTLGLATGATLLAVAVVMLAGGIFSALIIVSAAFVSFVVAFASAPLFARLPMRWPTRAAVLGAILGWALSAPLVALLDAASNAMDGDENPYEFLPGVWLYALVPLVVTLVVTGVRQRILSCSLL